MRNPDGWNAVQVVRVASGGNWCHRLDLLNGHGASTVAAIRPDNPEVIYPVINTWLYKDRRIPFYGLPYEAGKWIASINVANGFFERFVAGGSGVWADTAGIAKARDGIVDDVAPYAAIDWVFGNVDLKILPFEKLTIEG